MFSGADSGKRAAADFPGVDLEVVKAMLGAKICSKASNGSQAVHGTRLELVHRRTLALILCPCNTASSTSPSS